MNCLVCSRPVPPARRYCDHCARFFAVRHDNLKRRAALRDAYDRDIDAFRCHYSRAPLEEHDVRDPFYVSFDHYIPILSSRLVVTCELFNSMKFELGPEEFPLAVQESLVLVLLYYFQIYNKFNIG